MRDGSGRNLTVAEVRRSRSAYSSSRMIFEKEEGRLVRAPRGGIPAAGGPSARLQGFERRPTHGVCFDSGVSKWESPSGAWPRGGARRAPRTPTGRARPARGWFQSSLLTSVALFGGSPTQVVTTVRRDGPGGGCPSPGNVIAPRTAHRTAPTSSASGSRASTTGRTSDFRGDPLPAGKVSKVRKRRGLLRTSTLRRGRTLSFPRLHPLIPGPDTTRRLVDDSSRPRALRSTP